MVEALVAITILLIAVIGPLSLLTTALRDSVYLKNEITANYLAQEGLEVVIYLNDSGETLNPGDYCVDAGQDGRAALYSGGDCPIYLSGDIYMSARSPKGTPTIFSRVVTISPVTNSTAGDYGAKELKVVSKVIWKNRGFLNDKNISYTTYVFNY
jgi:type II secretory pathway pseudopilin PulG